MDNDNVFALGTPIRRAKYFPQADIRQRLTTKTQDADWVARNLICGQLETLANHLERNHIGLVVGNDGEAIDDRQCQRKANGDGRSLSFGTLNLDIAAQEFDVAANHVHTDASAGQIRDRVRGSKTSLKDKIEQVLVGNFFALGQQIQRARLRQNALTIEPGADVGKLDQNVARLVECGECQV